MKKFYKLLIGGYEINKYKELWNIYQKGAIKSPLGFNTLILLFFITLILSIIFPQIRTISSPIFGGVFLILILKFGEYKGYNECLHDLEND
ncbi:MAG: hypothetical protein RBS56_00595 [Candidatus Gracilibacteria bacterium]|jgi:hypothetical protein|nr:hypothetical protein [Candidatus Gracilibacteria bacterium]